MANGSNSKQYNKAVRNFAFTLNLHSPRAYGYVRRKFNDNLPSISTLRTWYSNVLSSGDAGINKDCIDSLQLIVNDMKRTGKTLFCSLSFDEMAMRRHVQWSDAKKKFLGLITYGDIKNGKVPIASQVLVFMVTAMNYNNNSNFSIPIAYHLIRGLSSIHKATLIREILTVLTEISICVINLTFDGLPNNFKTCELLGASFDLENFHPYILNPCNNRKIFIILDACHMIKLLRNHLATEKKFEDSLGNDISWVFFEKLENSRKISNFVTHKITKRHIQWYRAKMKVSLAVQLFSNSVSESLKFLLNNNVTGFENCSGTINFTKKINDLFDLLNSKRVDSNNVFKSAICDDTKDTVFQFFDEMFDFIRNLKIDNINIVDTPKKTGFMGLLIDIWSIKEIYKEYVDTKLIDFLPTFSLSQDPLECFFGRSRSLYGSNTNPTEEQFVASFRKLLVDNEINCSAFSNVKDQLKILNISSKRNSHNDEQANNSIDPTEKKKLLEELANFCCNDMLLNSCEEATIAFIAGQIEKQISFVGIFNCDNCKNVLIQNEKICGDFIESDIIQTPCISTVYICKIAHKYFELLRNKIDVNYSILLEKILEQIDLDSIYKKTIFFCGDDHVNFFVRYIAEEFIRIRATYVAKHITLEEQKLMCRTKYTQTVNFLGQ